MSPCNDIADTSYERARALGESGRLDRRRQGRRILLFDLHALSVNLVFPDPSVSTATIIANEIPLLQDGFDQVKVLTALDLAENDIARF